MANQYTPFSDDERQDIIDTIHHINSLKAQKDGITKDIELAETWLREHLRFDGNKAGTFHFGDKEGISVSYEVTTDYKVDPRALDRLVEDNEVSVETIDRCVAWKPSLKADAFKEMDESARLALSPAITTKHSKPRLKISIKGV